MLGLISFSWLGTALVEYASFPTQTSAALGTFNLILSVILLMAGVIGALGKVLLSAVILLATMPLQTASGILGCAILLFSRYGDLGDQVGPVEREAGVRKQL